MGRTRADEFRKDAVRTSLTELVRSFAEDHIQLAVKVEMAELIPRLSKVKTPGGRASVVR